jgi:hypothetical protein
MYDRQPDNPGRGSPGAGGNSVELAALASYGPYMRRSHGDRRTIRYLRPDVRLTDRRWLRLNRFNDPTTAEDDYFRLANRGR